MPPNYSNNWDHYSKKGRVNRKIQGVLMGQNEDKKGLPVTFITCNKCLLNSGFPLQVFLFVLLHLLLLEVELFRRKLCQQEEGEEGAAVATGCRQEEVPPPKSRFRNKK